MEYLKFINRKIIFGPITPFATFIYIDTECLC